VTMMRRHGSAPGRIKHLKSGEVMPARGTRAPRTVMRKPAGELNARSRVGIGGSVCANCPDRGPGRVAGSELVSKCRMVGTVTGVERPTPRVNLTADRFRRVGARIVLLVGGVPIRGCASTSYWVWGPSGGTFDYPFADWRGPTGGWGNS
jgi:hypothetical protein